MHAHVHEGHGEGSSLPKEHFIWKEPPMTWLDLVPHFLGGGCARPCVFVCECSVLGIYRSLKWLCP